MSKRFAIIFGQRVDNVAIADQPLDGFGGTWVDVTDMVPCPDPTWTYVDGQFVPPPVDMSVVVPPPEPEPTT